MDQAAPSLPTSRARPEPGRAGLRIAIAGAGFGGIGLAILLRQAGFNRIRIFEKGYRIGGTWRDNTYPGAACDVPSHLYSYSFAPRPDWSQKYSGQAEILDYIETTARRFGVDEYVRFHTAVESAHWDEQQGVWHVTTSDGATGAFDVFIPAVGLLAVPKIPDFPGRDSFAGPGFHSARWNHAVDLTGKHVALIGSAASAVQILPEIAKIAAHVDVYQRTPNWIVPRNNGHYAAWQHALFRHLPGLRLATRLYRYLYGEFLFGALRIGSVRNRLVKSMARKHMESQISDPDLREKLTPRFELGCKRILFSDDYYPSFLRRNVSLITVPIGRFEPTGIVTKDGRAHPAEIAVFATGFDPGHALSPVQITGRHGLDLEEAWRDGAYAYRGIGVPDFPNMFMLYGPNTNLGHNSIIFMLEVQSRYIVQCLSRIADCGLLAMEPRAEPTRAYNEKLQRDLAGMVWSTGCGAWYEVEGRITTNWSGSTLEYRRQMRRVIEADFIETIPEPAHQTC